MNRGGETKQGFFKLLLTKETQKRVYCPHQYCNRQVDPGQQQRIMYLYSHVGLHVLSNYCGYHLADSLLVNGWLVCRLVMVGTVPVDLAGLFCSRLFTQRPRCFFFISEGEKIAAETNRSED